MYMSLVLSYVANIIILSIVIFFILYIHKTARIIRNTNQELTKILYNPKNKPHYTNHKHNFEKITQQLIVDERNKNKKDINISNSFYQKHEYTKLGNIKTKNHIGGGPVEQQSLLLSKTQTPSPSIKSTVQGKYEKHIFRLKTLFLHEDISLCNQNKAKDDLKSLFTKTKIFLSERDLEKFDKYLKGDLFKTLYRDHKINYIKEFWLNFIYDDFETFKNTFVSLVNKYNEIHKIAYVQSKPIILTDPHISKMENNTCFVISMLYMIKTNSQLRSLIEFYCNDDNYKQFLFKLLDKKDNEVLTEEEFNILTDTSDEIRRGFKFKEQNDAVTLLECILFDKCELIYYQFYFSKELIVSKKGTIHHIDLDHGKPRFNASVYNSMMPIIELYIAEPYIKYDIQDILWGQQLDEIINDETCYSIPMFLKSPVFLGIKINVFGYDMSEKIICLKPTGKKDEKGKDIMINEEKIIYNFTPYGDFVIQEEIIIRSLADGETKYTLTGFLLYELFKTPGIRSGHYIPYYKLNGKWSCTYLEDRKTGSDVLPEFPLLFKFNKSYHVTMLFYEKV